MEPAAGRYPRFSHRLGGSFRPWESSEVYRVSCWGRCIADSAICRCLVAQNSVEALIFLALALTAGSVEEFVFSGYLQYNARPCGETRCSLLFCR